MLHHTTEATAILYALQDIGRDKHYYSHTILDTDYGAVLLQLDTEPRGPIVNGIFTAILQLLWSTQSPITL